LGLVVGAEDRAQALQDKGGFLGKGLVDLDELASPMGVIRSTT
jgi:hypothetical protein